MNLPYFASMQAAAPIGARQISLYLRGWQPGRPITVDLRL